MGAKPEPQKTEKRAGTCKDSVVYRPAIGEEIDHNVIVIIREECFPVRK